MLVRFFFLRVSAPLDATRVAVLAALWDHQIRCRFGGAQDA